MSDYGNYSSDNDSNDEIGLPKTPGAPLNATHSDSDEESNHNNDNSNDSNSEQSDDEDEHGKQPQRNDSNNDEDDDDSSDKKSLSSNDGSEAEKSSDSAVSDDDSDVEPPNKKRPDSKKDDASDDMSQENKKRISSSDSEDESNRISKKRKTMIDSSDDESQDRNDAPKPEDLFGELSDEDEETNRNENDKKDKNDRTNIDDDDDDDEDNQANSNVYNDMNEIFGDDEQENIGMDEEEAPIPETRIEVEIPRITADLGENIHFVKLPNFLSVDTHPYDPQWYEDEIDEDEVHDEEGRARLKLKVENTIRWRNVTSEDGQVTKESNARVVEWSDGSKSLHLGDEIFDIQTLNLLPGENNHLYIRQGTGLQGQSVFKTKLIFRPFSTESFTHRKLTLSLADRSQKTQKICVLPNVGKDPEAHRSEMIKKEEVRLKASIRKENKPKRLKDRNYTRSIYSSYVDDEDDESISISKIKNQYKRGPNYPQYSDYSDESDNQENEDNDDNDDSDLDIFEKKKSVEKRKIVESDDDD